MDKSIGKFQDIRVAGRSRLVNSRCKIVQFAIQTNLKNVKIGGFNKLMPGLPGLR